MSVAALVISTGVVVPTDCGDDGAAASDWSIGAGSVEQLASTSVTTMMAIIASHVRDRCDNLAIRCATGRAKRYPPRPPGGRRRHSSARPIALFPSRFRITLNNNIAMELVTLLYRHCFLDGVTCMSCASRSL